MIRKENGDHRQEGKKRLKKSLEFLELENKKKTTSAEKQRQFGRNSGNVSSNYLIPDVLEDTEEIMPMSADFLNEVLFHQPPRAIVPKFTERAKDLVSYIILFDKFLDNSFSFESFWQPSFILLACLFFI